MEFCSPFDEAMAHNGPAGVFLRDREGLFRFDSTWTRDAWGRAAGPHRSGWCWLLLRDRTSGYVQLLLVTSPTLLTAHPRADVASYDSLEVASATRAKFGAPPISAEPW